MGETKDWTWVLERLCPECGFDGPAIAYEQIPGLVRENAAAWRPVLSGLSGDAVRERPAGDTWSPVEYACHVRDVCTVFADRAELMRREDAPRFPDWDQDAAATTGRYREQDPERVTEDLERAAGHAADVFGSVPEADRARTGMRGDGASFTIDGLARYFLHELVHHLHDVRPAR